MAMPIDVIVEDALEMVGANEDAVMKWAGTCKCRNLVRKRAQLENWARGMVKGDYGQGDEGIRVGLERLTALVGFDPRNPNS